MCVQPSFRVCVTQVMGARDATTLERVSWGFSYHGNHHDKKQLGEDKGHFILQLSWHFPSLKEARTGTPSLNLGHGLKQRPQKSSACCLAHHGLLILLSYTTKDHSLWGGLALPYQSLIKKIFHRLSHRPYWWGDLIWGCIFPNNLS